MDHVVEGEAAGGCGGGGGFRFGGFDFFLTDFGEAESSGGFGGGGFGGGFVLGGGAGFQVIADAGCVHFDEREGWGSHGAAQVTFDEDCAVALLGEADCEVEGAEGFAFIGRGAGELHEAGFFIFGGDRDGGSERAEAFGGGEFAVGIFQAWDDAENGEVEGLFDVVDRFEGGIAVAEDEGDQEAEEESATDTDGEDLLGFWAGWF
ncbi:MAG: hypothetical protein RI897_164 [Verrucomicrobiota bacterium]